MGAELRVGRDDNRDYYVLGGAIASGGEATLFRGWAPGPGGAIPVAIKVPLPEYSSQLELLLQRWNEQVELLRTLRHPGIVAVREAFLGPPPHYKSEVPTGRQLYLVMDWVEGVPLDEWLMDHGETNHLRKVRSLAQIADVLDHVHSLRLSESEAVVHRDVKPGNILMGDGGPVLVDWGLVRGHVAGAVAPPGEGTAVCMAPEVATEGRYSPASDRFSFGCVVYFSLSGRYPAPSLDRNQLREELLGSPGLGNQYEAVDQVIQMLHPDPGQRPASCRNWLGGISRSTVMGSSEVPPAFPVDGTPTQRGGRRTRWRRGVSTAVVVLLLLLAGAGLGWRALTDRRSQSASEQSAPGLGAAGSGPASSSDRYTLVVTIA